MYNQHHHFHFVKLIIYIKSISPSNNINIPSYNINIPQYDLSSYDTILPSYDTISLPPEYMDEEDFILLKNIKDQQLKLQAEQEKKLQIEREIKLRAEKEIKLQAAKLKAIKEKINRK